ncbi:MAG TPA: AMP-binding protein, partial [Acidimicrobiales bacterium]|nr:AMP-binding protein [Acidimicrobiales bacterium]
PKIIVDPTPFEWSPALLAESARAWSGMGEREVQLVVGPFYHNLPFSWAHLGLFLDHHLVVMERFDAARALDLVERHRVTFVPLVPTMMRRMLLVPDVHQRDLSSLKAVFHTAAPCPEPVKRGWIELVGPERVYELYGATEATGTCMIRGDEWLAHPGSVGRPSADTEVRILDESRRDVPVGEVGEVFMRRLSGVATYRYVGSPPAATTDEGFVSVGDLGRLDADGYLYLADRRADLVITGGANVYPAEVEAALIAHPGVLDVVVIGLPSEEWGRSVHAVVQPVDPAAPPSEEDLARHCRERLTPYKVPKSFELVAELPRNEAGKVRRSALAAERATPAVGSTPPVPST